MREIPFESYYQRPLVSIYRTICMCTHMQLCTQSACKQTHNYNIFQYRVKQFYTQTGLHTENLAGGGGGGKLSSQNVCVCGGGEEAKM